MSRAGKFLGALVDTTLQLVFQTACFGCGRFDASALCEKCAKLTPIAGPGCLRCGDFLSQVIDECGNCVKRKSVLTRARSDSWLGPAEREFLHRVKFNGRYELLQLPRENVLKRQASFFPSDVVVVPVPLHFSRWRQRGFNQSALLADWLVKHFALRLDESLQKENPTQAQSSLSRAHRLRNLRHSFTWASNAPVPRRTLLVDDVWTTGATVETCARALKKAGGEEVYAWTLFRTAPFG